MTVIGLFCLYLLALHVMVQHMAMNTDFDQWDHYMNIWDRRSREAIKDCSIDDEELKGLLAMYRESYYSHRRAVHGF